VDCQTCRHALSARLDGEDQPAERPATDAHLDACPDCRRWYDDAAHLARLVATSVMTTAAPPSSLDDTILTAAPGPWRARLARALRWALGGLGAAQALLGITQITTLAGRTHVHTDQLASAGHLWHESAAWNLAVGAGFAWIATRRSRPAGLLPILTVFVAALLLLSLNDVVAGQVRSGWLLSHAPLLAGYGIVLLLSRPGLHFGDPPAGHGARRWSLNPHDLDDADDLPSPSAARRRTPDTPAARHDIAA
jgi:predicted anti-sigma-YlaC factor YlaD